jgi:hypothetical protein
MNEDPNRLMGYDDEPPRHRRPPQQKPHGNLRLVIAIMGAVIFGLFIALLVSGGGGETKTVTVTKEVTTEVEAQPEKGKSAEEEEAEEAEQEVEEAEGSESSEGESELESETGGLGEEIEEPGIEEGVEEVPEGLIEEEAPVEEEANGGFEAE